MRTGLRYSLLGFGLLAFSLSAQAKHKHKSPPAPGPLATPSSEPGALPAQSAPPVNPTDPPSVSLQPFVDTHLGTILAPLGTSAFAQPEVLTSLKASYADAMAAAPAAHKPAFALAMGVCDALNGAITERQNAVAALRGSVATRSSEAEQPRGGGQAVAAARDRDAFFADSQKNTWLQRANVLRQSVTNLYLRERAVERQIGPWNPPPAAPAADPATAPAATAPTPSVSAPPASRPVTVAPPPPTSEPPTAAPGITALGWDPVIGDWMLEGRSRLTLGADHTVTGGRNGTWSYLCTTGGGRNYEVHFPPPKNWSDYLVLSSDGKILDGKTRHNGHIAYYRQ